MDARFNRNELIRRIQRISKFREKVHIYNLDGVNFIRNILTKFPENGFVYIDPPYYKNGQQLYDNFFTHEDHEILANEIFDIKQNWVVSYDNVPEIIKLYNHHSNVDYHLRYTAQIKYIGSEIMFFSNKLQIPHINS